MRTKENKNRIFRVKTTVLKRICFHLPHQPQKQTAPYRAGRQSGFHATAPLHSMGAKPASGADPVFF